jgi:DNA polymerase-1
VSAPLLAVDGDSFAHRAYHALPSKSFRRSDGGPANILVGFSNMVLRLWNGERPRALFVAWDTLSVPTYRHVEFDGYQSGREFDAELLEQLDLMPGFLDSWGVAYGKGGGYEADDFLAAAVASEEAAGGTILVATSDRDAFQLASASTTIIQPAPRGQPPARIGPAEVRERYAVDPEQVVDFIALRGDPSDKIPGARGIGAKRAADLLSTYGTLDAMLEEGRFAAEADALRLFRRLATLDATAPLPSIPDKVPDWAGAASRARALGLDGLARNFDEATTWT